MKDTLTKEDIKKWLKNTLVFSLPAVLVLLSSLQSGGDLHIALGAAYSALLASLIDLLRKYSSGTENGGK